MSATPSFSRSSNAQVGWALLSGLPPRSFIIGRFLELMMLLVGFKGLVKKQESDSAQPQLATLPEEVSRFDLDRLHDRPMTAEVVSLLQAWSFIPFPCTHTPQDSVTQRMHFDRDHQSQQHVLDLFFPA